MTNEIFVGTPEELKARLDTIAASTLHVVVSLHQEDAYLIVYTP